MHFFTALTALGAMVATSTAAATPNAPSNHSTIDIKLSATDNTMVKAVITNTGDHALNLLQFNTVLDKNPTRKFKVYQNGTEVKFTGMLARYKMTNLSSKYFATLGPKASVERSFDIAATHDLSKGGKITVMAHGTIPTAEEHGTTIKGYTTYESNKITMDVDSKKAASVVQAMGIVKRSGSIDKRKSVSINRRTNIDTSSCSEDQLSVLETALYNSAALAQAAAEAAPSNLDTVAEYFKATDRRTVNTIVRRFQSVASESTYTNDGSTTYYCNDSMDGCQEGVLAYTLPSQNVVVNCPIYYSDLPALAESCHEQDQATTTLHEFTHNSAVVSPFCDDLGYGYDHATSLPASSAIQNADTYALFANAIYLGC
ncbi:metalloproteinase 8 [Arthroderma uncinatum]|uniref:metalloproteinase 8 n=1 Tax=Arthroderma uncinatum TaxID=74035 RepID=UPI00144AE590|nr:metalloproteinase 8 [Arthroderma uncinatum]KAF3490678.1 metalloproteinase 8 [Arthroderma uncinatum]